MAWQDLAEQLQAIPGMASCALLQGAPRRESLDVYPLVI